MGCNFCNFTCLLPIVNCFCCKSKCGKDPSIRNGHNGFHLRYTCFDIMMGIVFVFVVNLNLWMQAYFNLSWALFACGFIPILICIAAIGTRYLLIDKGRQSLTMSVSGCCCTIYTRKAVAELSNIDKFRVKLQPGVSINNESAVQLVAELKNGEDVRIVGPEQQHSLDELFPKFQQWFQTQAGSEYGVGFVSNPFGDIFGGIDNYRSNSSPDNDKQQLQKFLLKVKLKNPQKGKIIDMAFELDGDKIIEEYRMIKSITQDENETIELLVDKSDTILKARKIKMENNNDGNQKEGMGVVTNI